LAFEVLENHERWTVLDSAHIEDVRHVDTVKLSTSARLIQEARNRFRVSSKLGTHYLDCNRVFEDQVPALVDYTHASFGNNAINSKPLPDGSPLPNVLG
jgi:hypothetical protein